MTVWMCSSLSCLAVTGVGLWAVGSQQEQVDLVRPRPGGIDGEVQAAVAEGRRRVDVGGDRPGRRDVHEHGGDADHHHQGRHLEAQDPGEGAPTGVVRQQPHRPRSLAPGSIAWVDLADMTLDAWWIVDTGASGWPKSPHYGDQYERWFRGDVIPQLYHFLNRSIIPTRAVAGLDYLPGGFDVKYGRASSGIVSVTSRGGGG